MLKFDPEPLVSYSAWRNHIRRKLKRRKWWMEIEAHASEGDDAPEAVLTFDEIELSMKMGRLPPAWENFVLQWLQQRRAAKHE